LIVGIIGDTHFPAVHPEYLSFLRETFKLAKVQRIIHIGDVTDCHRISRHISEPDTVSATDELEEAKELIKEYAYYFPKITITEGNHDAIPKRQLKELGLPKDFLKSWNELYQAPDSWIKMSHVSIQSVWYEHGIGSTGMYGCVNTALKYGLSYVQGHTHGFGGCLYRAGPERTLFGLNVGCGVDTEHPAMRYGENFKYKPTLGCGLVQDGKIARFVPMT